MSGLGAVMLFGNPLWFNKHCMFACISSCSTDQSHLSPFTLCKQHAVAERWDHVQWHLQPLLHISAEDFPCQKSVLQDDGHLSELPPRHTWLKCLSWVLITISAMSLFEKPVPIFLGRGADFTLLSRVWSGPLFMLTGVMLDARLRRRVQTMGHCSFCAV